METCSHDQHHIASTEQFVGNSLVKPRRGNDPVFGKYCFGEHLCEQRGARSEPWE